MNLDEVKNSILGFGKNKGDQTILVKPKVKCGVYFYKNGVRIEGLHEKITGDITDL